MSPDPIEKDREIAKEFFTKHSVFNPKNLSKRTFEELLEKVRLVSYEKNDHLYKRGSKATHIYIVQYGEVHNVQRISQSDQVKLLGIQTQGDFFGEVSLLTNELHSSDSVAAIDSDVFIIASSLFMKIMNKEPKVASHVAKILSQRFYRNLNDKNLKLQPMPAKVFALFYPEMPARGSELSHRIAATLANEKTGSVLLITFNKHSPFFPPDSAVSLNQLIASWPNLPPPFTLNKPNSLGFSFLTGLDIHKTKYDSLMIAKSMRAILGYLRCYFKRIFIDAGDAQGMPVLTHILSQCENVIFVRNANVSQDDSLGQAWQKTITYTSKNIHNFFDRVITVSDDCSARGGSSKMAVNVYSALYKSHFHLHTATAVSIMKNKEKIFIKGLCHLVRKLNGTSRGLALGGGGARGLAHIGVIDVFEQEGIYFDGVAGTSMGALVGAKYASGKDVPTMLQILENSTPSFKNLADTNFPSVSLFKGYKYARLFMKILGRVRFEDLKLPFYCNATDLLTGQMVVFEKGYVSSAVWASANIPIAFPPIKYGSYRLVDGGIVSNIPGNILRKKGFHKIIGVNVSNFVDIYPTSNLKKLENKESLWKQVKAYFGVPPIFDLLSHILDLQNNALTRATQSDFDCILYPKVQKFGIFDFGEKEKIIELGREAAFKRLDEIKAIL